MAAARRNTSTLTVEGLTVRLRRFPESAPVVEGVGFRLESGQSLGILGESGSGKTSVASAVMGLLPPQLTVTAGSIRVGDHELVGLSTVEARTIRMRSLGMVFQDPMTALNPVQRIGRQIGEALWRSGDMSKSDAHLEAVRLLGQVHVPEPARTAELYPHQLSGGMRQRALIAMALAMKPQFLIADEPTTALDVRVQAEILALINELRESRGMGLIIIGHDLAVLAQVADRVAVMYGGRFVEVGPVRDTYRRPIHPYTNGLLDALPSNRSGPMVSIPGSPPRHDDWPGGCVFHPRCPRATSICDTVDPDMQEYGGGRRAACHHPLEGSA